MEAEIIDEDEEGIGVQVVDNNGVTHTVAVGFDGEVQGHSQDGYPDDPSKRSHEGGSSVNQAQRLARYHVYRERSLDVIPGPKNPDRIAAAITAVLATPSEAFEESFRDLRQQLRSHYDGASVELPFEGVDPSEVIVYEKELYVIPDPVEVDQQLSEALVDRLGVEPEAASVEAVVTALESMVADPASEERYSFSLEAVSGLHYRHNDGYGHEQVHRGEDPLDREPDARVELFPVDPEQFPSFQLYVAAHLLYQLRDCFLGMGLEPPLPLRVQGQGSYELTLEQQVSDTYERYYDPDATVESWQPG